MIGRIPGGPWVRICAAFLGALLPVAAATEASAGPATTKKSGPFRYATSAVPTPAADDGSAVAPCPNGSRLTGGGGRLAGAADQVRLGSITPFDFFDPGTIPDDAYLTEGYNNTGNPTTTTSTAICLRNGKGGSELTYSEGDGPTIDPGASVGTGASATCAGGRAVGGGLYIPGPATTANEEQLNSSHPRDSDQDGSFDDGWGGSLNVSMSTVERTPRATVICLPPGPMKFRYRSSAEVVFGGKVTRKVTCPKGFRVSGGGIQGFHSRVLVSTPFDNKDKGKAPDNGWRASVWNVPGGNPQVFLLHAICLQPK